jgi:galactokinase/mevalonate kinase-like predicted kinase
MSVEQVLVSLPAGAAARYPEVAPPIDVPLFVASDPPGSQLGSGGGTAHLLHEAWRHGDGERLPPFPEWMEQSRRLLIHGSGESRRLPAYAAPGKPLVPLPPFRHAEGWRMDQTLLDVQVRACRRLFAYAPQAYRLMVACGDVLVTYDRWAPSFPRADVLIVGLTAPPDEAQRHGVMVCPRDEPERLLAFLHKPSAERIRALAGEYAYYLDTGIWLLSARALRVLMSRCGWRDTVHDFAGGRPAAYELYGTFGLHLGEGGLPGTTLSGRDDDIASLHAAVLPLTDGRFYHFGTTRSLLASTGQLQHPAAGRRSFGHASLDHPVPPVILHADVRCELGAANRFVWIENATIPEGWRLSQRHVLTGIPPNDWSPALPPGACLDIVPVIGGGHCLRAYGFDDDFRGALGDPQTSWLGQPARQWFTARGMDPADAGLEPETDLYDAAIFPVMDPRHVDTSFVEWLVAAEPPERADLASAWRNTPRLSARRLLQETDVVAWQQARLARLPRRFETLGATWPEPCLRLDLGHTARLAKRASWSPPGQKVQPLHGHAALAAVHDSMFRSALAECRGDDDAAAALERQAFDALRRVMVGALEPDPVLPQRHVLDDQIVWGRAPVRLDLAGGWTDTPPYCLEHGGSVVNLAVDLNGQPPIQVFARTCKEAHVVIRSIDLGVETCVRTYEELRQADRLGSGFGIARAALALAGFDPRFHQHGGADSLEAQLRGDFGGGIELTLLAAVPKGSGLGTSSILAATLLGTLSELCGLYWSSNDLLSRTLALEQMMTSGGGWQDQAGGLVGGLKLIETTPGVIQRPVFRWLPAPFFSPGFANTQVLLYYTGLTRVAHDILGEIVKGIFLNDADHLGTIREIGVNAQYAADALQRRAWDGLCEAVRRSWQLNQRLDRGTNPPEVQAILDEVADFTAAAKLLGAGGGGYLLLLARDAEAGQRIRERLESAPPNPRARFVDLSLSETGFQVTKS